MTVSRLRLLPALKIALCTAACGGLPPVVPAPAPARYGGLAAAFLGGIPAKPQLAGAFISAIQPSKPPQPAEYAACVKLASGAAYAVFYGNGAVTEARSALPVDRCDAAEGYGPLPPPFVPKPVTPPDSKPAAKKPAATPATPTGTN